MKELKIFKKSEIFYEQKKIMSNIFFVAVAMGLGQSIPVASISVRDTGDLMCIALRRYNKVGLLQAPSYVVDMTAKIVG